MAIGTKFYYETIIQQARIQFYLDDTLTSEWIVQDGDNPILSVPPSSGITINKNIWEGAVNNVMTWVDGIRRSGIILLDTKEISPFILEIKLTGSILSFEYIVEDTNSVEYVLRKLSYNKSTDQVEIEPRIGSSLIHWVNYLQFLKHQSNLVLIVDTFQKGVS
jgi:hypothetical protein